MRQFCHSSLYVWRYIYFFFVDVLNMYDAILPVILWMQVRKVPVDDVNLWMWLRNACWHRKISGGWCEPVDVASEWMLAWKKFSLTCGPVVEPFCDANFSYYKSPMLRSACYDLVNLVDTLATWDTPTTHVVESNQTPGLAQRLPRRA